MTGGSAGTPPTGAGPAPDWIVEADELEVRYGSYVAIAASTFRIPRVGVVSVIGPNGSGKSTLLSALAGLVPVSSGRIQVMGAMPEVARARMSYVMQATPVPPVTPITVGEVVGLGRFARLGMFGRFRRSDRAAVADALARMEISHLARRHMHELSGGQRQRVLIAQGIVQDHELLVLDEPLTGLDITSAATIDDAHPRAAHRWVQRDPDHARPRRGPRRRLGRARQRAGGRLGTTRAGVHAAQPRGGLWAGQHA